MAKRTPYVQRRGDLLFFRIAVPIDLRPHFGGREITKTLQTADRRIANPRALLLASRALKLFSELRVMPKDERDVIRTDYTLEFRFDELGHPNAKFSDVKPGEEASVSELARQLGLTSKSSEFRPASSQHCASSPKLSEVIAHFLKDQATRGIDEMMKKHTLVLPLVLDVVGDKPIANLRQGDILDLFDVINRLPKHAKYDFDKGMSYRRIADLSERERLSKATFDRTYRASISMLLEWAITNYQDQGFPVSLTVEKLDYRGSRKEAENKQRAFTEDELRRIFEGPEMQAFASNPDQVHQYWLPLVGLFSGARVNEICQINPHIDIRQDGESGIWYFLITDETESDDRIEKSVKTKRTREVPIHSTLIELGFLDYVNQLDRGEKLLFPRWKPKGARASPYAAEFFTDFLKQIGLHGVKNAKGFAPRGMHAFRHTLLTYGYKQGELLFCISGHVEDSEFTNKVAAGYIDMEIARSLIEKKQRLDKLTYPLRFHRPSTGK